MAAPGSHGGPGEPPDHPPLRLFPSAAAIRAVGEGMLARKLPVAEWTHEAHLATCLWLITQRADIVPERDLPALIAAYNESQGGVNSDTSGYHETITQLYIAAVRDFVAAARETDLLARCNALFASPIAPRDWPLTLYSREHLFSVAARRGWAEPDLAPLPFTRRAR